MFVVVPPYGGAGAGIARRLPLDDRGGDPPGGAGTVATESIVSVGQAIRREVAAMGDGVDERALARAGELESLVHNEGRGAGARL